METKIAKVKAVFSLLAVVLFAVGCKKPVETTVPTVVVVEHSVAVGYNTALLCAEVTDNGGASVTGRGFCYGKVAGSIDTVWCEEGKASFSVELGNLTPSATYTCKAFAVNSAGWGFSEEYSFTMMNYPYPVVMTYFPTDVTLTTAMVTGRVVSDGGQDLTERGICYSTEETVTINAQHVSSGSGMGEYTCQLTGLQPSTVYYARAYAVSAEDVYYGEEWGFVTECLPMEVRTIEVTDVTATRVKAKGEVIRDGCYDVTECGFCWGTEHLPAIEGYHVKAGSCMGEFSCYFSGVVRGVPNYVRAYSINEKGIAYGEEVEFVPDDSFTPWFGGALPSLFSVSPDRQVRFSQGNLQFYPDERVWRFAERQWDFVGGKIEDPQLGEMNVGTVYANGAKCDNTLTWKYYEGWMDLFGWGTSGWDNGNEYYRPYDFASYVYNCASYGPPGNFDLTGDYAEADWGVHNTISNGGSRQWRTPTVEELVYLLTERETPSGMLFASAVVAGVSGIIVLPDNWEASTYPLNVVNMHCDYKVNTITGREWLEILEPAGAVFLPAGGTRFQFTGYEGIYFDWNNNEDFLPGPWAFSPNNISGSYWTTTQSGMNIAYALVLFSYGSVGSFIIKDEARRCNGRSVRLISEE